MVKYFMTAAEITNYLVMMTGKKNISPITVGKQLKELKYDRMREQVKGSREKGYYLRTQMDTDFQLIDTHHLIM